MLVAGIFMLKWNDQSRYRPQFSQEWYALSDSPFNYRAILPPSDANASGVTSVSTQVGVCEQVLCYVVTSAMPRKVVGVASWLMLTCGNLSEAFLANLKCG
jgi:hypothetical protein